MIRMRAQVLKKHGIHLVLCRVWSGWPERNVKVVYSVKSAVFVIIPAIMLKSTTLCEECYFRDFHGPLLPTLHIPCEFL